MLKAEATDMKMLPVAFDFDFAADARKLFHPLKGREPLPVAEEVITEEHLLIDEIIAQFFGFQKMEQKIRDTLFEQVNFRVNRARGKV